MYTESTLTNHAFIRCQQRLSLSIREIFTIVDREEYIVVGKDKQREHRLFWSYKDDDYFILIQDINTNEIITILPYNYHELCSFKIDSDLLSKVKNISYDPSRPKNIPPPIELPKDYFDDPIFIDVDSQDTNNTTGCYIGIKHNGKILTGFKRMFKLSVDNAILSNKIAKQRYEECLFRNDVFTSKVIEYVEEHFGEYNICNLDITIKFSSSGKPYTFVVETV